MPKSSSCYRLLRDDHFSLFKRRRSQNPTLDIAMGGIATKGLFMKKFVLSSAAALLLATGGAHADSTRTDNWYASILGGASFAPPLMAGGSLHDMDTGYNVGARVGYGLDNFRPMKGWSAEADLFYNAS